MSVEAGKQAIREQMKSRRRALSSQSIQQRSQLVHAVVLAWDPYVEAGSVMFYMAFGGEVLTAPLMRQASAAGKTVAAPRVQIVGRRLNAHVVSEPDEMCPGAFGIPAPPETAPVLPPDSIDLVVVPALAFDRRGHRLGFGGGYYDRFLAHLPERTVTLGLAFDFQLLDALPVGDHDQPLDYVATETEIIDCRVDS